MNSRLNMADDADRRAVYRDLRDLCNFAEIQLESMPPIQIGGRHVHGRGVAGGSGEGARALGVDFGPTPQLVQLEGTRRAVTYRKLQHPGARHPGLDPVDRARCDAAVLARRASRRRAPVAPACAARAGRCRHDRRARSAGTACRSIAPGARSASPFPLPDRRGLARALVIEG